MLRPVFFALFLVATGACAQTPPVESGSDRGQEPSRLPSGLLGVWVPYGRGYQPFGDLTIGPEVLSWGSCWQVPYRVYRTNGETHYLELVRSPPCKFGVHASFLILVPSDRGLEVSICREQDEFDRPPDERFCSRGLLYKKHDSPPVESGSDRGQDQVVRLPISLIGVWRPYSDNYLAFGDLTVEPEVLSWDGCSQVRYKVLRTHSKAHLVQLLRPPSCKLRGEASFLILETSDQGLEVSICREPTELGKPRPERSCSWGILEKND